jgi:hypothetical protein
MVDLFNGATQENEVLNELLEVNIGTPSPVHQAVADYIRDKAKDKLTTMLTTFDHFDNMRPVRFVLL